MATDLCGAAIEAMPGGKMGNDHSVSPLFLRRYGVTPILKSIKIQEMKGYVTHSV